MANTNVKVITHSCIEGHTAAGMLGRVFGYNIDMIENGFSPNFTYETATPNSWMNYLKRTIENEKISNEKPYIFITDLHIPESRKNDKDVQELLNLIAKRGKVFLIDHHESGKWLMRDKRINAFVTKADSACDLVFKNLSVNFMDEKERKALGASDIFLKFPEDLRKTLKNNISKEEFLKFFNYKNSPGIVKKMNDIDSGRGGHGAVKYVFHADKKNYVLEIAESLNIIISPEQEKQFEKANVEKEKRIANYIKEAKFRVKSDKYNRKFIMSECPKDEVIHVNDIAYKIEEEIANKIGEDRTIFDYMVLFRTHQINNQNISASVRSFNPKDAPADKIAAEYGGGGHEEASGFLYPVEDEKLTYDEKNKKYVIKELESYGKTLNEVLMEVKMSLMPFANSMGNQRRDFNLPKVTDGLLSFA